MYIHVYKDRMNKSLQMHEFKTSVYAEAIIAVSQMQTVYNKGTLWSFYAERSVTE